MKRILSCLLFVLITVNFAIAAEQEAVELKTDEQKLSYALGLDLGSYFKNMGEDLDLEIVYQGLTDAYNGNKPKLSAEEAAEIQQKFAQKMQQERLKKTVEMLTANNKAAEEFLKENGTKEGIQTTESGLQYEVIKQGEGAKPSVDDVVKVHYSGRLLDGTEFDSSYVRNEPAVFPLKRVIPGWIEGLQLMTVGSKYKLFLPPKLAYGDRGMPPKIEPGSMLIFEVELLGIENGESKKGEE